MLRRRFLALLVIGIAHAVLIWWGDIVACYAILGLLLLPAARWTPRTLTRVGIALVLVQVIALAALAAVSGWLPPDWFSTTAPGEEEAWGDGLARALDPQEFGEGSYVDVTLRRLGYWALMTALFGIAFSWRTAGLMLLGMAWTRQGWLLDPAARPARVRRLIVAGLAFGAPLQAVAVVFDNSARLEVAALAALALDLGSLGMTVAYAGLVARAVHSARGGAWLAALEAVGRTALSNYLLQSVVCTLLFYPYGLGLFGTLGRPELWGVVGLVWTIQLGLTRLWLRHFHGGPVEWLWRTMAYGEAPPFLRRAPRPEGTRLPV